ncbi:hypothetical protein DKX38_027522 [Salix brachista]|uniref:Uncharacterized protein n=1 Tax=Salix brachista TaxID=2182728 RepID=A0A5N5JFS7_9ROSI|nr:hypothetical protein DKX38_027522 [Salix brachista]
MEEALVLYPSPPIGHLVSMVELGKLMLTRRPSLSIHILIAASPYVAGKADKYMATVSANFPSIDFHHLPTVTPVSTTVTHHEELTLEVLHLSKPHVHEELRNLSKRYKIHGLVMDFFCSSGLSVANELDIPGYFFLTSGACFLAFFLHLPTLHQKTSRSFKDMKDQYLDIPGLPPILATDLPNPFLDRDNQAYQHFLDFSTQFPQASGIMINTFELLESKVIKAISDGLCVPNNRTPPISCIGPLIVADDKRGGSGKISPEDVHECLSWLDSQPSQSVVFLCFGSLGLFTKEQLWEIATGLENSGQRVVLVEEMKLALSMNESEDGFVSADEVEKKVRGLMESTEGKMIRERASAMKNEAKAALSDGGSSHVALSKLLDIKFVQIILITHPKTGDLRESLKYIYNLYVEYVVKNPIYTPGAPIRCELFNTSLDQYTFSIYLILTTINIHGGARHTVIDPAIFPFYSQTRHFCTQQSSSIESEETKLAACQRKVNWFGGELLL